MADKKYKLRFQMTDGTEQSVAFTVPGGSAPVYPCTDGTYFWRELDAVDPLTGSNRVYLHPPKEPVYNMGTKNTANIFRTDDTIYSVTKNQVCPVYYATIVCSALNLGDPDSEGLYFEHLINNGLALESLDAYAIDPSGGRLTLPFIDDGNIRLSSVFNYDDVYLWMGIGEERFDDYKDSTVIITMRLIAL